MQANMIAAAMVLLAGILPMAVAADENINLYPDWGHEKDVLDPANITMLEVYYAFNISGTDWDSLAEDELYDIVGILKQYQEYDVLVNYLILRDGTVICLAENDSLVWHAKGYNNNSLGVRFVAPSSSNDQSMIDI